MDQNGTFIVIEGTDGSGKGTQFKLLAERLTKAGYEVATFDFPQYDQPSSFFVREYLNGKYGTAEEVGPYAGSLFYALDRYNAAAGIRKALADGKVVLANRFTGSNMAHQGTKFLNDEERRGYFIWLDNLEFVTLRVPRPTKSFVLRVPAETAQKLVGQKAKREYTDKSHDIHEADLNHMQKSVEVYDDLCRLFPNDFQRIDCVRSGKLLEIEVINDLLWETVLPLLPEKPGDDKDFLDQAVASTAAPSSEQHPYYVPSSLSGAVKVSYTNAIDTILNQHAVMLPKLVEFIRSQSSTSEAERDERWLSNTQAQAEYALRAVLPVASISSTNAIAPVNHVDTSLEQYGQHDEAVRLTNVWPRNELDLLPYVLYEQSHLSVREIEAVTRSWSYDKKLAAFQAHVRGPVLQKAQYSWDLLCDYGTYKDFQQLLPNAPHEAQELTPRYGFEVPDVVEAAGLGDDFEDCFVSSLRLHSQLQAAGHKQEAPLAALIGHKIRWQVTYTAAELSKLRNPGTHDGFGKLATQINEKFAEAHPLIAESIA